MIDRTFMVRTAVRMFCKRSNVPDCVMRDAECTALERLDRGHSADCAIREAKYVAESFLRMAGYTPKGAA